MSKDSRIVITGIGPITSIGIGKKALWDGIVNQRTGIIKEDFFLDNELIESFLIHKVNNFDINSFGIDSCILEDIKRWKEGEEVADLYYLMAAAKLALDDSGLVCNDDNKERIGLVLTHENPGLEHNTTKNILEFIDILKNTPELLSQKKHFFTNFYNRIAKTSYESQTFMFLYHVARVLDVHGFSLFTNNACSSGLYALETARLLIDGGRNDVMIIASGDNPQAYKAQWFKGLQMYAEDGKTMPFDKNAHGFVLGDGAIGIVIERLEHARQRDAFIYAEYRGGGFLMEGWKVTLPDIGSGSYQKVITHALEEANLKPEDIDIICAHGVGNLLFDKYEAKAIQNVFGLAPHAPLVTALKPFIGHNLGGTNLLETAIMLLAMHNNIIPPVLNSTMFAPSFKINLVREQKKVRFTNLLKISCGFAGFNTAALFSRCEV